MRDEFIDTTWATGWNTVCPPEGTRVIEIDGPELLNTLWRSIGVVMIPHLPCSFRCEESLRLAEQLNTVGRDVGYSSEMDWAAQMLRWPAEWSALHGIAEIKTPILKMSTNTVATPFKYIVRWLGSSYPSDGAKGLGFPYQAVKRSKAVDPVPSDVPQRPSLTILRD